MIPARSPVGSSNASNTSPLEGEPRACTCPMSMRFGVMNSPGRRKHRRYMQGRCWVGIDEVGPPRIARPCPCHN